MKIIKEINRKNLEIVKKEILNNNLLTDDGIIIAETDEMEKLKNEIKDIKIAIVDERKYGRNQFLLLKKVL